MVSSPSFIFLIWFTFLHLWGVLGAKNLGARWLAGHLCGFLVLGAMGSGVLSSFTVVGIASILMLRQRRWDRIQLLNLGVSAIWITVGLFARVHIPAHDVLKADSISQFLDGLSKILTWPFAGLMPWACIFVLTLGWRCLQIVRQKEWSLFDRVFLGLVAWFLLVVTSTAYLRAHAVTPPRYFDQFYLGLLLQGIAIFTVNTTRWKWLLAGAWLVALTLCLIQLNQYAFRVSLSVRSDRLPKQETRVREFLQTQDSSILLEAPREELVYPSGQILVDHWSHNSISSLLPAVVRPPVSIPGVDAIDIDSLPPAIHPVIVHSSNTPQTSPWTWQSPRMSDQTLPVLRFKMSGGLGDPHAAITMLIKSDTSTVEVVPDSPARGRWKTINVLRPQGEWWIEVTDSDSIDHIVLTAPVELGWLSWASEKMIKYHQVFIGLGLVFICFGLTRVVQIRVAPSRFTS